MFYGPSLWRHNSLLCDVGANKGTEAVSRLSPELLAETVSLLSPLYTHTGEKRTCSNSPPLTGINNLISSIKAVDAVLKLHRICCEHQMN